MMTTGPLACLFALLLAWLGPPLHDEARRYRSRFVHTLLAVAVLVAAAYAWRTGVR